MSKIKVTYKASKASELTFTEQAAKVLATLPYAAKKVPLQTRVTDAGKQAAGVLAKLPSNAALKKPKTRTGGTLR